MAQLSGHLPTKDIHSSSSTQGHNPAASSPTRPTSSYTLDSTFADSAVDMEATPTTDLPDPELKSQPRYLEPTMPLTPLEVDQTLSDKMRQLAAVAWAMEQDDEMPGEKRQKLHTMLDGLEAYLESSPEQSQRLQASGIDRRPEENQADPNTAANDAASRRSEEEGDDEWIDEAELIAVRESLAATVKSMRQRQEEQRHLHQLTAHKLEAVAQRCLVQEQQVEDLVRDVRQLRLENHSLSTENDRLRERIACLEDDASRNEVAVEAMSSAVTGLEGWIESTHPSAPATPVPVKRPKRQKVVIRGKGRFRGRYYVDEDGDEAVAYSLADAATDSQDLHDGVKAWLRGFRDVEEELRQHDSPGRTRPQGRFRDVNHHGDDEWGDFQSPASHT